MAGAKYIMGTDEQKLDSHYSKILSNNKKSSQESGTGVKQINKGMHIQSGTPGGVMKSGLMTWTQMLESMEEIEEGIDQHSADIGEDTMPEAPEGDMMDEEMDGAEMPPMESETPEITGPDSADSKKELLEELNKIFTPILVMQGFEGRGDKIQAAMSEASVLTEKNIIQFDDETRMAQLIATCALLIERQRNSEKYQVYEKAAKIKNQMKVEIQKSNYDAAKQLAQEYLVKVSTTNNNSIARDAATSLLPATQH